MNRLMINILVALFSVFAFSNMAMAEDYQAAHLASPDQYDLIFENDRVMVLKMELEPGEADIIHRHNNETVYFQTGGKLRIAEQGGEVLEADIPTGHVMWHQAWVHQVTNIGDTTVVAIIVEDKE